MDKILDLHMHTIYSDGTLNKEELLKEVKKKGLEIISITDHNSVESYLDCNPYEEIRIITGVEVHVIYEGEIIEVLCYGFDVNEASKLKYINRSKEDIQRHIYNSEKERLIKLGYSLDLEKEFEVGKYASILLYEELIKYDENIKKNPEIITVDDKTFYRKYCCVKGNPFFIDFSNIYPSIDTVIEDFHNLGAKIFVAHPFLYSYTEEKLKEIMQKVEGVECGHGECSNENSEWLLKLSKEHGKLVSGGSDYHGPNSVAEHRRLGEYSNKELVSKESIKWVKDLLV